METTEPGQRGLKGIDWLTERMDVRPSWVYAKCEDPDDPFPHIRVGRYLKFDPLVVEAWIEAHRRGYPDQAKTKIPAAMGRRGRAEETSERSERPPAKPRLARKSK